MLKIVWRRFLGLLLCVSLLAPGAAGAQAVEKKNNSDWIWISAGVSALIYLLTHHHSHAAQESSPSPGPTPTRETPTTPATPQPVVTATPPVAAPTENVPCKVGVRDGYMQPTQGIWQDDRIFPEPHILDRLEADYPLYQAYYPLIVNRPTLLAGVYKYNRVPGGITYIQDRGGDSGPGTIKLGFSTNCDHKYDEPVRLEFALYVGGKQAWKKIYDPGYKAPFQGYAQQEGDAYTIEVPAPLGYPSNDLAFTPTQPGDYVLMAHIQHLHGKYWEDVPGLLMTVHGSIVRTHGFEIHYVPIHLTSAPRVALNDDPIGKAAKRIGEEVGLKLPDLYPLQPSGGNSQSIFPWKVESDKDGDVTDLSRSNHMLHPEIDLPKSLRDALGPNPDLQPGRLNYENALLEEITNTFGLAAVLEKAGRMVIVLNDHDFDLTGHSNAGAYTTSEKLIAARAGSVYTTIGHELAHTLPWEQPQDPDVSDKDSVPWMLNECQQGYHNVTNRAEGLRFIWSGKTPGYRKHYDYSTGLMGPVGEDNYDEQCTYRHLTDQLKGTIPDPRVFLVRGYLARSSGRLAAAFTPFYTVDSMLDNDRVDPSQDLRIILRGSSGAMLKEVSYKALFVRPDDIKRAVLGHARIIAFYTRIPYVPGTREIQLVSRAHGVLATKAITGAPPVVRISASASSVSSTGRIALEWSISSSARGPLYSSVFDSTNGGKSYVTKSIEQSGTSLSLRLEGKGPHVLRVVVSDGSQSGEATVRVQVKR